MLFSLALIFLGGIVFSKFFKLIKLPEILGMLLCGILFGPYVLNLFDDTILHISKDLREIALIIILFRAGLNLSTQDLIKVGRPGILMCFIPACFEIIGMVILAPILLGVSVLDAIIMGTVVAAVSPAIIVPRMIKIMKEGYGVEKKIPQMIMAASSVDDVFVIVLFTTFLNLARGGSFELANLFSIPLSIVLGILVGIICGFVLILIFNKFNIRNTHKVIISLSVCFLFVILEDMIASFVGFSGLLAVITLGIFIRFKRIEVSNKLSTSFSKLWVGAELLLFVLVGATVNISYAINSGFMVVILIFGVLLFRVIGVFISLIKSNLTKKERIFMVFSYIPKATVQAAISSIPLSLGVSSGDIVLTVGIISIIITAPIGAIVIDKYYKRLLS